MQCDKYGNKNKYDYLMLIKDLNYERLEYYITCTTYVTCTRHTRLTSKETHNTTTKQFAKYIILFGNQSNKCLIRAWVASWDLLVSWEG